MKSDLKILTLDIETGAGVNGFKADLAVVLCVGFKWAHEKTAKCLSILDYGDLKRKKVQEWDKGLLVEFSKVYSEADITVGHYSSVFDLKFINGRLLLHGLPPLPPIKHVDTCFELRKISKFSSNRLGHVAKLLKLSNKKKENGWPEAWIEVTRNPKKHVGGMIPYCKGDVLATEELFIRLRPFMKYVGLNHVIDGDVCPKCSSPKLQKRGRHITVGNIYQRLCCQSCGGWCRSLVVEKKEYKNQVKDL